MCNFLVWKLLWIYISRLPSLGCRLQAWPGSHSSSSEEVTCWLRSGQTVWESRRAEIQPGLGPRLRLRLRAASPDSEELRLRRLRVPAQQPGRGPQDRPELPHPASVQEDGHWPHLVPDQGARHRPRHHHVSPGLARGGVRQAECDGHYQGRLPRALHQRPQVRESWRGRRDQGEITCPGLVTLLTLGSFQSVHYASKERGGERISRMDSGRSRDSGYSSLGHNLAPPSATPPGPGHKRGVSPTPLGNLKLYKHPDITDTGKRKRVSQTKSRLRIIEWSRDMRALPRIVHLSD